MPVIPLTSTSPSWETPLTPGNHLQLSVTQNIQMRPQILLAVSAEAGLGTRPCACCHGPQLSQALELSYGTTILVDWTHWKYCLMPCMTCRGCAGLDTTEISPKFSAGVFCGRHPLNWECGHAYEASALAQTPWAGLGLQCCPSPTDPVGSVLEWSKSFVQV